MAHAAPPLPTDDSACFLADRGWSFRLRVRDRMPDVVEVPEAIAGFLGVGLDEVRELTPEGAGPTLTLRRGRRRTRCTGPWENLVSAMEPRPHFLFVNLAPPHYGCEGTRVEEGSPPIDQVASLVGLGSKLAQSDSFWAAVSRRLGLSPRGLGALAAAARKRGDEELAAAILASMRGGDGTGLWRPDWDLTALVFPQPTQFALMASDAGPYRVAMGVADPRDRLGHDFIVTDGGMVWAEVGDPDDAHALRLRLTPDVVAPVQNDTWRRWMRDEHGARRASLSGERWRLESGGGDLWSGTGVEDSGLIEAIHELATRDRGGAVRAQRSRHLIARSTFALRRAVQAATAAGVVAIASDQAVGFVSEWRDGLRVRSSTILGTLDRQSLS